MLAGLCSVAAASPDQDKLRLLFCEMSSTASAAHKDAVDWFNRTAEPLARGQGHRIAGPVTLGKACLRNVTAAGIALYKDPDVGRPEVVLGKLGKDMRYLVTEGRMDEMTGKVAPGATRYSFTCMAAYGGPQ